MVSKILAGWMVFKIIWVKEGWLNVETARVHARNYNDWIDSVKANYDESLSSLHLSMRMGQ